MDGELEMFSESYKQFVNCAKGLPGFIVGQKEDVPYDITDLANGYIKAKKEGNQILMSQYISALMVRYWHVVVLTYNQSLSTRLDFEDIVMWIYEGFEKAFTYCSWLDPTKAVSRDPKGAEKCINRCITTVRQYWYSHFNKDKRKINFITSSLNDIVSGNISQENETTVLDTVADPSAGYLETTDSGLILVKKYLEKGDYIGAIVLDGIVYQDCFVDNSKLEVVGTDEEGNDIEHLNYDVKFSLIKLIKHLKSIGDDKFISYFSSNYEVDRVKVADVCQKIASKCNATLVIYVKKTLSELKDDKEVMDILCM